jgi:hypothetical protein
MPQSNLPPYDDTFSDEETARRRDEVIRRMIATPPKLHSEMKRGKGKKQATNPRTRPASKGRVHKGKTRA